MEDALAAMKAGDYSALVTVLQSGTFVWNKKSSAKAFKAACITGDVAVARAVVEALPVKWQKAVGRGPAAAITAIERKHWELADFLLSSPLLALPVTAVGPLVAACEAGALQLVLGILRRPNAVPWNIDSIKQAVRAAVGSGDQKIAQAVLDWAAPQASWRLDGRAESCELLQTTVGAGHPTRRMFIEVVWPWLVQQGVQASPLKALLGSACDCDDIEMLTWVLTHPDAAEIRGGETDTIMAIPSIGQSPMEHWLCTACRAGSLRCVKFMLSAMAHHLTQAGFHNSISAAVFTSQLHVLQFLLTGSHPFSASLGGSSGAVAGQVACYRAHPDILRALLAVTGGNQLDTAGNSSTYLQEVAACDDQAAGADKAGQLLALTGDRAVDVAHGIEWALHSGGPAILREYAALPASRIPHAFLASERCRVALEAARAQVPWLGTTQSRRGRRPPLLSRTRRRAVLG